MPISAATAGAARATRSSASAANREKWYEASKGSDPAVLWAIREASGQWIEPVTVPADSGP
jgi:hypothetical protein